MNIFNLLTKEKQVAGIEISDSVVRVALIRPHKKTRGETPQGDDLVLIEEPIAGNIIENGVVVNSELLGKTLKTIWDKANLGTNYAIVSIPHDKVYSHIFSFPRSVEGARLTEAMRLAISFQLPIKTDDSYLDWERTGGTTLINEILLSMIPRAVAQGYIDALDLAGIKTIALESHLASIARAIKMEPGQTALFTEKTPDGVVVFALRDRILRFSRTLPEAYVSEPKVSEEVGKIKKALEAELKHAVVESSIMNAEIRDDYATHAKLTEPRAKWLIALGAGIRGKIPAGEDNLISLLPVGTEEAYAYQRATTFASFIRNMTMGVSVFFVLAFGIAYLFMLSISQNTNRTIATLSTAATPGELTENEGWVERVNALTGTARTLISESPIWSIVFNEVTARTIEGIVISGFSATSIDGPMSITGVAKDRPTLNKYKELLQNSPVFTGIDLPINNLEQRSNIPFSISLRLKDPSAVYYK